MHNILLIGVTDFNIMDINDNKNNKNINGNQYSIDILCDSYKKVFDGDKKKYKHNTYIYSYIYI